MIESPALEYAAATTALGRLAWITGSWAADDGESRAEEHWLPAAGGLMLGVHRDVANGRAFFEYLRIVQDGDRVEYVASPMGRGETSFLLVSDEALRAVFENPDHDFPQRIIYWIDEDGALRAAIEDLTGGRHQEWVFTRAR